MLQKPWVGDALCWQNFVGNREDCVKHLNADQANCLSTICDVFPHISVWQFYVAWQYSLGPG